MLTFFSLDPHGHAHRKRTASGSSRDHHLGSLAEESDEDTVHSDSETSTVQREERDFLTNPYWIEDRELKKGEVDFMSSSEMTFWKDLIDKYLYPIEQDKAEQVYFYKKKLYDSDVFDIDILLDEKYTVW